MTYFFLVSAITDFGFSESKIEEDGTGSLTLP